MTLAEELARKVEPVPSKSQRHKDPNYHRKYYLRVTKPKIEARKGANSGRR